MPWQATELRFDLVSAVDELAAQLQQEFDFRREAETMDLIHARLKARPLPGSTPGKLCSHAMQKHTRVRIVCARRWSASLHEGSGFFVSFRKE